MPTTWVHDLLQTSVGRTILHAVQPALHYARQRANPGLPNHMGIARLRVGSSTVALVHRRWSASDRLAIQQCFTEAQYEMPAGHHASAIQQFYDRILARGRTPLILDCGANIGASVRWLHLRYPAAHIIAVEPAPANCDLLRRNTTGLDVQIVEGGIASSDGTAFLAPYSEGGEMGCQTTSLPTDHEVVLFSVATLLHGKSPDLYEPFLLKVDIEGAEHDLFSHNTDALARFPFILLEPHDWLAPGRGVSANFLRFHLEHGRDLTVHNENVASVAWEALQQSA